MAAYYSKLCIFFVFFVFFEFSGGISDGIGLGTGPASSHQIFLQKTRKTRKIRKKCLISCNTQQIRHFFRIFRVFGRLKTRKIRKKCLICCVLQQIRHFFVFFVFFEFSGAISDGMGLALSQALSHQIFLQKPRKTRKIRKKMPN